MNRRSFLRSVAGLLGCASPTALLSGPTATEAWREAALRLQRALEATTFPASDLHDAIVTMRDPSGQVVWERRVGLPPASKEWAYDWAHAERLRRGGS